MPPDEPFETPTGSRLPDRPDTHEYALQAGDTLVDIGDDSACIECFGAFFPRDSPTGAFPIDFREGEVESEWLRALHRRRETSASGYTVASSPQISFKRLSRPQRHR